MPRKLEEKETLQTLNHWRSVLTNYYRRCQFYGYYLQPDISWDNSDNRGFTVNETSGLKRTPAILASDLNGFLSCIASYLPFDYISDKLILESTNMDTVWSIIYEIYDADYCHPLPGLRHHAETASGDLPELPQSLGWVCASALTKTTGHSRGCILSCYG